MFKGSPSSSKVKILEVSPINSITFWEYNNKVVKLEPDEDKRVLPFKVTFFKYEVPKIVFLSIVNKYYILLVGTNKH